MFKSIKKRVSVFLSLVLVFSIFSVMVFASHDTLGVFEGLDTTKLSDFEDWTGKDLSYVLDFLPSTDWAGVEGPGWKLDVWQNSVYKDKMVLLVPMLPDDTSTTLAIGATGAYNSHFISLAQNLVDRGMSYSVIRIGHEFNGTSYRWSCGGGNEANYANYFKKIVTAMRGVPGQHFKFMWNPKLWATVDLTLCYPGDNYVDIIAGDIYDQVFDASIYPIPAGATDTEKYNRYLAAWNKYLIRPWGLNWFQTFASQHGKPMALAEWGCALKADGTGGGDNPYFIQWMHDWMNTYNSQILYQSYFDLNSATITSKFDDLPATKAKFFQLFGNELLANPSFESGITSWTVKGAGAIASSTTAFHSGLKSIKATGRTNVFDGVQQDIKTILTTKGQGNYNLGAWVKLSSGTGNAKVALKIVANGVTTNYYSNPAALTSTKWAQAAGTVNIAWTGTITSATLYVQTTDSLVDMYVDDVSFDKVGD